MGKLIMLKIEYSFLDRKKESDWSGLKVAFWCDHQCSILLLNSDYMDCSFYYSFNPVLNGIC